MNRIINLAALHLACQFAAFSNSAFASGFAIAEQSVKGLGSAFSNTAEAGDASTVFFNAAGLGFLEGTEIITGGHIILPRTSFTDQGSTINAAIGGGSLAATALNAGGDPGVGALVPNLYMHHQLKGVLGDRVHLGFGINAPFGLKTNWEEGWTGRYHALTSSVKTINFNPTVAFAVTDTFSVGAGVSPQYIEARLTNAFDQSTACIGALGGATCGALGLATPASIATDGHVDLRNARDWSLGWNAVFSGSRCLQPGSAPIFAAKLTLPESASFQLYHELNDQWALTGMCAGPVGIDCNHSSSISRPRVINR